jgi:hypothetical protein
MVIALNPPATTATTAALGQRDVGAAQRRGTLSSRVYLPAFSIVAVAAALITLGLTDHWGGNAFGASMTSLRVVLVGPLSLATVRTSFSRYSTPR